jgi:hypothetical protein
MKILRRAARIFTAIVAAFAALFVIAFVWFRVTAASAEDLPSLKTGDLVFQSTRDSQSLAIMLASRSALSHMGMVEVLPGGETVVLEAIGPVLATPLDEWIERGVGGRLLVRRLPSLSASDAMKAAEAARAHFGKPYDIFFHEDRETIYCSELVDYAFRDGPGIELGKYQPVSSLDLDNFAARNLIERRWRKHPSCANGKAANFETCFAIILKQKLITPQSIADDTRLETVYSNYGAFGG